MYSKFHRVCTLRRRDPRGSTLTNGYSAQFVAANRVSVSIEDVKWLVLPKLMTVASDIFTEVLRCKASKDHSPQQAPPAKKAKGGLRQRDPW